MTETAAVKRVQKRGLAWAAAALAGLVAIREALIYGSIATQMLAEVVPERPEIAPTLVVVSIIPVAAWLLLVIATVGVATGRTRWRLVAIGLIGISIAESTWAGIAFHLRVTPTGLAGVYGPQITILVLLVVDRLTVARPPNTSGLENMVADRGDVKDPVMRIADTAFMSVGILFGVIGLEIFTGSLPPQATLSTAIGLGLVAASVLVIAPTVHGLIRRGRQK